MSQFSMGWEALLHLIIMSSGTCDLQGHWCGETESEMIAGMFSIAKPDSD